VPYITQVSKDKIWIFQVSLTFWHRSFQFNSNKLPTWSNNFSVYYPEVCLHLNMFRTFTRPSSGAQWLQWQPLVLPSYRGDSRTVLVVGPAVQWSKNDFFFFEIRYKLYYMYFAGYGMPNYIFQFVYCCLVFTLPATKLREKCFTFSPRPVFWIFCLSQNKHFSFPYAALVGVYNWGCVCLLRGTN
jgi:hypothetical protein